MTTFFGIFVKNSGALVPKILANLVSASTRENQSAKVEKASEQVAGRNVKGTQSEHVKSSAATNENTSHMRFERIPTFFQALVDTNFCVLGNLSFEVNTPLNNDTKQTQKPLLPVVRSRLSENAFLTCNAAQFGCELGNSDDFLAKLAENLNRNPKETLNQLEGDFTLAHINPHDESLLLATSIFNPQTLFYAILPEYSHAVVVSSNINVLLALLNPIPNKTAIAMWLAGRPDPNMSMYSNIQQVAQASSVKLCFANTTVKSASDIIIDVEHFWDLDASDKPSAVLDSDKALSQKLTQLLSSSIALNLQSQSTKNQDNQSNVVNGITTNTESCRPNSLAKQNQATAKRCVFTQLSGGMDSTSISALAHTLMPSNSGALHSISHTYASTTSCDESDNISAMHKRYDFAQTHFIELDKYTHYTFAQLYPTHPQSPGMVLSPKYHEEAKLMKAAGAELLLTGNGGDEMFWGHSLAYYDRLKKGDFAVVGEVVKGAKELDLPVLQSLRSVFVRPLVQYDILPLLSMLPIVSSLYRSNAGRDPAHANDEATPNELGIPVWISAEGKTLIRNAKKRVNPFAGKKSDRAKYARYEGLHYTSTFNSMRSYQAVFDEYDLQVQHPFFSKAIAEFSFAIEQNKHISGKYPKLLLRQAMSDYLPKQVCWDTHKTVFDQHFAKLVQQNHQALRKLLQHEGLQSLGLLDNSKLLSTFDTLVQSETPSLNVDLLYAILVQSWYQTHILKIDAL